MSVRSDILTYIDTTLKSITGVGDVFIGKYEQVDLEALTYPALFVLQGSEQESPLQDLDGEAFRWSPVIEAWCSDTTIETLFASIVAAMKADSTLGGFALKSRRTGSDILSLDPGRGLVAMQLPYEIDYEEEP